MNISLWITSTTRELTAENWGTLPLGGAEVSAVNLGNELLKLGHEVTYYLQRAQPFDRGKLHVKRHNQLWEADYFICVRPHEILEARFRKLPRPNKIILWSGDAFDQSSNEKILFDPLTTDDIDAFIFKSNWQKEKILEKFFSIDSSKVRVIHNGVRRDYFEDLEEEPQRNRFIHASTYYRGVYNFTELWPRILEKIPDAELYVYSKASLYSEFNPKDDQYWPIAEELAKIKGIYLCEPIPQWKLAHELRKSWAMLYPNTRFVESSCGVALQSLAAGTPVVATARAGLPETIRDYGILIEETEDWKDKFVEGTIRIWEKHQERNEKGGRARKQVLNNETWGVRAREWENFLTSL